MFSVLYWNIDLELKFNSRFGNYDSKRKYWSVNQIPIENSTCLPINKLPGKDNTLIFILFPIYASLIVTTTPHSRPVHLDTVQDRVLSLERYSKAHEV